MKARNCNAVEIRHNFMPWFSPFWSHTRREVCKKRQWRILKYWETAGIFKHIFQLFSCRCCGSWKMQDTLQILQCSHPVAYSRVPAFLGIDKTVLEPLKKARNNSLANRMVDDYDKTGWESPWHRASQQLHALKKMLACPSTDQELRNFLFFSPPKQVTNLVSYSLPLRDEDWEINRAKSPAIYFHYLRLTALAKDFLTTFL